MKTKVLILLLLFGCIKKSNLLTSYDWLTSMLVFVQKAMTHFVHNFFHIFNLTTQPYPNLNLTN
jgi:hypothetical protein